MNPGRTIPTLIAFLAAAAPLLLGGCTDMYNDSRIKPLQESKFYADHQSARPLVEGTVPRGMAENADAFHTGKAGGAFVTSIPVTVDSALLARGQDRFNTFCSPCHGRTGEGDGMIVQRGFPKPNSYHQDSVRAKPDGFYFDVITNGFGRMYSYAPSVPVADRWAIVSYIRALQLSRQVEAARLRADERERLNSH
jgi:mono/diheme cytochrome c family protein